VSTSGPSAVILTKEGSHAKHSATSSPLGRFIEHKCRALTA
jgi:hypothetical protein